MDPKTSSINWLYEQALASARTHAARLERQRSTLNEMQTLARQLSSENQNGDLSLSIAEPQVVRLPALFTRRQLDAFASGSPVDCFGESYRIFEGRRIPRIPNGDFLLMSRVIQIDHPGSGPQPGATILTEYDCPDAPWFLTSGQVDLPYSILLEMALQPCGFLTAFLGTMRLFPDQEFFFRNLDGKGRVIQAVDVRGKTISCKARLLSHTAGAGTIIQGFAFELSCNGLPLFTGESVFGYFHPDVMARQTGLDNGQAVPSWLMANARPDTPKLEINLQDHSTQDRLSLLERIIIVPSGGRVGKSYIWAEAPIRQDDWYFSQHFYQDPVMPGSLGVEAVMQALSIYARSAGYHGRPGRVPELATTWKYRGQITPATRRLTLEIDLQDIVQRPGSVDLIGQASVWGDDIRLYQVDQAGLRLTDIA